MLQLCQTVSEKGLSVEAGSFAAGLLWQQSQEHEHVMELLGGMVALPLLWLLAKLLIRKPA
jgi:hypothetical protein